MDQTILTKKDIEDAVIAALGRGQDEGRYIDVGRIPFICDDIRGIHVLLASIGADMKSFGLVKAIVYGFVAAILTGSLILVGDLILMALSVHG